MPEIFLTPDLLLSKAKELETKRAELNEAVKAIQTLVESLKEHWRGDAQDKFCNSFLERKSLYDKFSEDMSAFSAFMEGYARDMQAGDSSATPNLS